MSMFFVIFKSFISIQDSDSSIETETQHTKELSVESQVLVVD